MPIVHLSQTRWRRFVQGSIECTSIGIKARQCSQFFTLISSGAQRTTASATRRRRNSRAKWVWRSLAACAWPSLWVSKGFIVKNLILPYLKLKTMRKFQEKPLTIHAASSTQSIDLFSLLSRDRHQTQCRGETEDHRRRERQHQRVPVPGVPSQERPSLLRRLDRRRSSHPHRGPLRARHHEATLQWHRRRHRQQHVRRLGRREPPRQARRHPPRIRRHRSVLVPQWRRRSHGEFSKIHFHPKFT